MVALATKCLECGVSILAETSAKTGGKCVPCARGTRAQMERGKRWNAEQRERRQTNSAALERIRRKGHPTFNDFLVEEDPLGVLWPFIIATVFRGGSNRENIDALTPSAKLIYLAQVLDGEVFNGGFHQYFSNSSGRHAHRTIFALHELAAPTRAQLLQHAIDAFPGKRVPIDRKERNDELDKTDSAILGTLDTQFYALANVGSEDLAERLLTFMKQHAGDRIAA